MTDKKLRDIFNIIKEKLSFPDDNALMDYLEAAEKSELIDLSRAVEQETGEGSGDFYLALLDYLTIKAKPWSSKEDLANERVSVPPT